MSFFTVACEQNKILSQSKKDRGHHMLAIQLIIAIFLVIVVVYALPVLIIHAYQRTKANNYESTTFMAFIASIIFAILIIIFIIFEVMIWVHPSMITQVQTR